MAKLTANEYSEFADKSAPNSPMVKNMIWAFIIGGLICVIGQIFTEAYQSLGMSDIDASGAASVTLILISAILTGFDLYDNIAKFAGAGTIVPITGFANAVMAPAIEFKSEGYILGVGAKMFVIAGPVIVYGTVATVIAGVAYYLLNL
jgi:stage V sporulation protein AC